MSGGSGFELNRLVSAAPSIVSEMSDNGNGLNGGIQVGDINPEYHMVSEKGNHVRHQSVSTDTTKEPASEYDVVPDISFTHPPPLPGPRRVTSNPVYETRGNTFNHPATLDHRQQPQYTGETEMEPEYKERNPRGRCLLVGLSILVAVGLVLALAAVALVLLMWFGVHVPGCPVNTQSTAENNCSCPSADPGMLQNLMDETLALNNQLRQLNSTIMNVTVTSSGEFDNLTREADILSTSVNEINDSCLSTLDTVRNTPVSLENTTFKANLSNAGVFSQCLYEYLSNCTIGMNDTACQTTAHPITVDGYFNLEQTCHVFIELTEGAARFAPVNNIVIDSQMMSCSCALVRINSLGMRSGIFTCYLFRARCPNSSNLGVPVIVPNI